MDADSEPLPDDIDALKAEVAAGRARAAADQALMPTSNCKSPSCGISFMANARNGRRG